MSSRADDGNMTRRGTGLLSKTRYIAGLQCPRYLWVLANDPDRIPPPDAGTQFRFDQGHEVGNLAKKLFPEGIDIPSDDFAANLQQSHDLLSARRPLFEAAFTSGGKYARLDILQPTREDAWNIIEVKSSTSVKDVHYPDVAFQKHCCEEAGRTIDRCFLAHVNSQFVRNGDILPETFFEIADITDGVAGLDPTVSSRAEELLSVMASSACPEAVIGPHCFEPYECPLHGECWAFLPYDSVFTLYRIGKQAHALLEKGIASIAELPAELPLTREQQIQRDCVIHGTLHAEPKAIRSFLRRLVYPVHYLDFETFGTAIPLFDGVRPYQQVPFLFTLQIVRRPGEPVERHAFLAEGRSDPRPDLASALRVAIGDEGSVVAYNASFEIGVLRSLAAAFPELQRWTEGVCARMVDLLVPFRGFNYYHPMQQGSASLKHVLPALTGEGYDGLYIADGTAAGLAYLSTLSAMPEGEVRQTRANLLEYCNLDSSGMVRIVEKLEELSQTA
jgi:hypothetical protein